MFPHLQYGGGGGESKMDCFPNADKPLPCGHTLKYGSSPTRDGLCPKCDMKRKRRDQRRQGGGK